MEKKLFRKFVNSSWIFLLMLFIGCHPYPGQDIREKSLGQLVGPGFSKIKREEIFNGNNSYRLMKIKFYQGDNDSFVEFETTEDPTQELNERLTKGHSKMLKSLGKADQGYWDGIAPLEMADDGRIDNLIRFFYKNPASSSELKLQKRNWNITGFIDSLKDRKYKFFSNNDKSEIILAFRASIKDQKNYQANILVYRAI